MKKAPSMIYISLLSLVLVTCSDSPKADTLLIMDGDNVKITGKVTFELNPEGKYSPKIWAPGYIVVCRSDGESRGNQYKAGFAYRITKELKLKQICPVDLKLSDEQLQEKFLNKSK